VAMLRGRRDRYHRLGLLIPLTFAAAMTPVQIGVGDWAARFVAASQPVKLAAMEGLVTTRAHAPEAIGGLFYGGRLHGALKIPDGLSLLLHLSPAGQVTGLSSVPAADQPPVAIVHLAFDTMVGIGFALLALGGWLAWSWWRRRAVPGSRWFLRGVAASGVAAVTATEAGWITTEVGRQPWIVYGVLRVAHAVNPAPGRQWDAPCRSERKARRGHPATTDMPVDPVRLGERLEPISDIGRRLGAAEDQNAALAEGKIKQPEDLLLGFRAQVDEEIATGDQVEAREWWIGQDIVNGKYHEVAQLGDNSIRAILLLKKAGKSRRGDVRRDRLRINPVAGERHRVAIDIGGEDLQYHRRLRRCGFLEEEHRDGVGLFASAAAGNPDPQWTVRPVPAYEIGDDLLRQ
jgi:hypothetical protein